MIENVLYFFHSFDEDGEIKYQGIITQKHPSGSMSGYLLEWNFGTISDPITFTKKGVKKLKLFDSDYEMRLAIDVA